jgi:hypothetical protein
MAGGIDLDPDRVSVSIATGIGGLESLETWSTAPTPKSRG